LHSSSSHAVGGKIGRSVSVKAQFVGEDRETVPLDAGLVGWYRIGQSIKHEFQFGCVDFFGFLFCSSSQFLWAQRGCGFLWV